MTRRAPRLGKWGWEVESPSGGVIEVSGQDEALALERYIVKHLESQRPAAPSAGSPVGGDEETVVARPARKRR